MTVNRILAALALMLPTAAFAGPKAIVFPFDLIDESQQQYEIGVMPKGISAEEKRRLALITDELTLRQQEITLQRQENQIRVEVQNAVIGVQQARARYQAAQKARVLQEQTVDAEQKKYELGASTIYNVILTQRDLLQAQSNEVAALSA